MRIFKTMMFAGALACLALSPAMAVDLKAELKQVGGKSFDPVEGKPVTLGSIARTALLATYPEDQNVAASVKFDRWKLANKIDAGDGNLSVEEIKLVKDLIGKAYGPSIVGPAWLLLDPGAASK